MYTFKLVSGECITGYRWNCENKPDAPALPGLFDEPPGFLNLLHIIDANGQPVFRVPLVYLPVKVC